MDDRLGAPRKSPINSVKSSDIISDSTNANTVYITGSTVPCIIVYIRLNPKTPATFLYIFITVASGIVTPRNTPDDASVSILETILSK